MAEDRHDFTMLSYLEHDTVQPEYHEFSGTLEDAKRFAESLLGFEVDAYYGKGITPNTESAFALIYNGYCYDYYEEA